MPKASFYLDHCLVFRHDDVRLTGQCVNMKAEANAQLMQRSSDDDLRLRVFGPNACHIRRSLSGGFFPVCPHVDHSEIIYDPSLE